MAKINRYDSPAESNYFNTFVPLPLDQITALGMKRQGDLERKQDVASKYIDEASLVNYIAGSKDEEYVRNTYLPDLQKKAEEAMSMDLTNPVEWARYSTKLRSAGNSDYIRRIEESKANYDNAQKMKMQLRASGKYNELLDEDPSKGWDSANNVYNYTPEAYTDKAELFEQYYKHMRPQSKGIITLPSGLKVLREGIDVKDVQGISNSAAQQLAATPQGQQQIKLFRKMYPEIGADMDGVDILRMQMEDYGQQYIQSNDQILPQYMQGSGKTEKQIPESPYISMTVPGQSLSLEEQDRLDLFDSTGISSRSTYSAKADISKAYKKEGKTLNKPISEWAPKDFAKSLFLNPVGGFKIAQAIFRELPKDVRDNMFKGTDFLPEIANIMAESQAGNPLSQAALFQISSSLSNITEIGKAIINPSYISRAENLDKVALDIENNIPDLAYRTITKDGIEYKEKLSPKETLNNYVDVLNAGTRSDVKLYNIQDETSWKETNDYAARSLLNRSAEVGGPNQHRGMRPIDLVLNDLGYKDAAEVANIMSDHSDNRVKLLGYGVDSSHPGTFAISIQDNNKKAKGKGKIMYVNADDVVSRNLGAAHALLSNAKLKQEVDVPWNQNEFIRLKYKFIDEGGRRELAPVLELWHIGEDGESSPSLDEKGNIETVGFDAVYRAALTKMSGEATSPIAPDRGKVLNVGFRSDEQ